jgi:hypothetical protein
MPSPTFTREEFQAGLDRLGERDVRRLLEGGALDGDEARWASAWLQGERAPIQQPAYGSMKLAS